MRGRASDKGVPPVPLYWAPGTQGGPGSQRSQMWAEEGQVQSPLQQLKASFSCWRERHTWHRSVIGPPLHLSDSLCCPHLIPMSAVPSNRFQYIPGSCVSHTAITGQVNVSWRRHRGRGGVIGLRPGLCRPLTFLHTKLINSVHLNSIIWMGFLIYFVI